MNDGLGGAVMRYDEKVIDQASRFWASLDQQTLREVSHWVGHGKCADLSAWAGVGRRNFERFERLHCLAGGPTIRSVVEWGCGGGANAVEFSSRLDLDAYYGVDVWEATLVECERQLGLRGHESRFHPIFVPLDNPETVLGKVAEPVDLFICTAVYQFFPSAEYGARVTRIAHQLLRPGGLALLQIKYCQEPSQDAASPTTSYASNPARFTLYRLEDFWRLTVNCGFKPLGLSLEPSAASAYYYLRKSES